MLTKTFVLGTLVLSVSVLIAGVLFFKTNPKISLNLSSAALQGDLNNDGIVNSIDWSIMNSKWLTSDPTADLNKDGLVNTIDWSLMNANWLKTSPPPPPPPAPTPVPPPPSGGSTHSYFNNLSARPDKLAVYSLRDPNQLKTRANGGYAQCNACPLDVTYTYPNDPDPRKQDAAKIVIGTSNLNSLKNQLHLPIPQYSGAFMVTWDAWWGSEFKYSNSGIPTYKAWQLANGASIWTEPRSLFSQGGSNGIAKVDMRYYGTPGPGTTKIGDALAPILNTFIIAPETWTRYWVYINPAGSWYELSYWMADANRDPVQILDKRLVTNRFSGARWDEFWVEFNTSTDTVKAGRGNLVAYVRNVAILRGLSESTATSLLQKPLP